MGNDVQGMMCIVTRYFHIFGFYFTVAFLQSHPFDRPKRSTQIPGRNYASQVVTVYEVYHSRWKNCTVT